MRERLSNLLSKSIMGEGLNARSGDNLREIRLPQRDLAGRLHPAITNVRTDNVKLAIPSQMIADKDHPSIAAGAPSAAAPSSASRGGGA